MEIGDRIHGLNESKYLNESDDDRQSNYENNLIDISNESEIVYRNKLNKNKPNYNSFHLTNTKATNRFNQTNQNFRTISISSDDSLLESTENDSLLQTQELSNRNKIQLNPIRE